MTNKDAGEKLFQEAQRIFERDLKGALQEHDFNLTIRRAQEVVELLLKGGLKLLGIDYPKVHDVGMILTRWAREKMPHLGQDVLERIEKASTWLGEARRHAFYFGRDYTEQDAQRAYDDSWYVLEEAKKIFEKLNQQCFAPTL